MIINKSTALLGSIPVSSKLNKIQADSITVAAGTPTGTVANLRTKYDGNFLRIQEIAAAPGIDVIVDFVDVKYFKKINSIAGYAGSSTHAVAVQIYNWVETRWDTFDSIQNQYVDVSTVNGYILSSQDHTVESFNEYIGTGVDSGKVRVRYYHTMSGNPAHNLYIDVCALYR